MAAGSRSIIEPSARFAAFKHALGELDWVEGQNLVLEARYAEGQPTWLPALAAELVRLTPDVIGRHSTDAIQAVKQTTTTIPIVIRVGIHAVEEGLFAGPVRREPHGAGTP